jgi:hypothetical protein
MLRPDDLAATPDREMPVAGGRVQSPTSFMWDVATEVVSGLALGSSYIYRPSSLEGR